MAAATRRAWVSYVASQIFRVHGPVHVGLIPGLAIAVAVVVFGASALILEWPSGWLNLHFGFGFGFVFGVGSAAFVLSLVWQALIAYGAVPLVVVWRGRSDAWVGTAMAPVGLSRRRIRVQGRDVRVELLGAPHPQNASVQIVYPRVASGGASRHLRSRGAIDPQELQEFLVSCAVSFGAAPATESEDH